jgi:ArsR family transcriptional regulator
MLSWVPREAILSLHRTESFPDLRWRVARAGFSSILPCFKHKPCSCLQSQGFSVYPHAVRLVSKRSDDEVADNPLTFSPYFCNYRNMPTTQSKKSIEKIAKYADMFSAMGTEPRLRIMQLLLSAHPDGLVVGEIQEELDIPNSTLSHHLDKLKAEDLVHVERESTFLHYTANTEALQELLQFLYAECCTRNKAVKPDQIIQICK